MNQKNITWNDYTIQITKKKIKRTNLRIKPSEPNVIHMSIPYRMSYESAMQVLNQPRILRWIENSKKKRIEQPVLPERSQESVYSARLEELLPGMFEKWESRIGVRCSQIAIRDTRSQWGSCSLRTKNISISVWLGAFPEECIEYVVVHELVHLLEPGHNARFYGFLDEYYPKWRECRQKLKKGL